MGVFLEWHLIQAAHPNLAVSIVTGAVTGLGIFWLKEGIRWKPFTPNKIP